VAVAPHACSAVAKPVEPDGNMPRDKIPSVYKWNLSPLFVDDAAFEAALGQVAADREKIGSYQGKLSDPKMLRECLDLYFATRLLTNKATLYSSMRLDTNVSSTKLEAMHTRALAAMNDLIAVASFIRLEVLAMDDAAIQNAYAKQNKLREYRPYIEGFRRRRSRVLSPEGERILSLAGDNLWAEIDLNEIPSDFERTFQGIMADLKLPEIVDENGKTVQLTFASFGKYRASKDRRVRRETVEKLFGTLKEQEHALAGTFAGQINFNIFLARARGYDTALEAYFDKDNIDTAVYANLIDAVRANVEPLYDYVAMRKEVLGLDEVHIYDLYTPLFPGVEMSYTFEQARDILPKALAPLGPEYSSVVRTGLDPRNGWIDVYPHENKRSGAFCSSVYDVHPFVKMNYFNDYNDLSTLAHEYGHAMHAYLSNENQPYVTFNYPAFTAEIASTTNEKLLNDYLLANAKDDQTRLAILSNIVETIRATVYRQTLFAEFELKAHTAAENGTPLTADLLNDTYAELIRHYYGPGFTLDENDGIEWAYVPHFYYKYYMVSYATGLSSGIALADLVKRGPKERDAYLGMLEGGSSKPPLALLKDAGVDLTKPDAILAATRLMKTSVERMRDLLAKNR
jgi:oligoendopeptidase F